jgi:pimeloyl-ACP methyl ester carboxylesterase
MSDRRFGVQDAALDDLRARLQNTRWPSVVAGRGWERGADLDYVRELVDYWTVTGSWNGALRAMRSSPSVTLYWVTNTIGSSFLPYVEYEPGSDDKVTVPTGVTIFPKDMVPAPRQFAERFFRIVRWTELRAGGHFTACEEPEAFARELTARQETWSLRRAMADRY